MDGGDIVMKEIKHGTIFQTLEKWAPKSLAYDWDNVGLQVGAMNDRTKNVLVTLDVLESTVDEAIEQDVNLIIAHHPMIFKALKSIDFNSPKGRVIKKLIEHNITVYAAHTNLDIAKGGVNDLLIDVFPIKEKTNLIPFKNEILYKLVVFVPLDHEENLRDALSEAGAGHIGAYSHCSFRSEGQGTFKPLEGTNPFIGEQGELTIVDEVKLETIVPEAKLQAVLTAMEKAHPYEEVAHDIIPLKQTGESYGLGRVGTLEEAVDFDDFVNQVKEAYKVETVSLVSKDEKPVKKIAVLGGSGQSYIEQAKRMGADVYITGDITFHQAQDAMEMDLQLIDPGHYVEEIMKVATKKYVEKHFPQLKVIESKVNTNPFQFR